MIIPFVYLPYADEPFDLPKWSVIQAMVCICVVILIITSEIPTSLALTWKKITNDNKYIKLAWMYICIALISLLASKTLFINIGAILKLLSFVIIVQLVNRALKNNKEIKTLFSIMIITSAITSIYCIIQYHGFDPIFKPTEKEMSGYMVASGFIGNPNSCAAAIAATIPLCLSLVTSCNRCKYGTRFFLIVTFGISGLAIYYTSSRAAMISTVCGIAFFWGMLFLLTGRWRIHHFILVAVVLILGIIVLAYQFRRGLPVGKKSGVFSSKAITSRVIHWRVGAQIFKQHPLLGLGPGNYERKYRTYEIPVINSMRDYYGGNQRASFVHNEYLQVAVDTGFVGLLVITYLIILLISDIFKIIKNYAQYTRTPVNSSLFTGAISSILVTLLISCVHFPLHSPVSALFFAGVCGTFIKMNDNLLSP